MAGRGAFRFGTDPWDPSHRFETSWVLSPWVLFWIRALFAVYALFTSIFTLGWSCTHAPTGCDAADAKFSYFTVLTYWGLAFYFLVAAVHTFTYARTGVALLDRFPRPLQALHSAYYSTIVVYPFIVTIVFWGILFDGPWFSVVFDGWSNVSQHALNSAFALFEIFVPRTNPMPPVHMLWLVLVLALYLAVAYITHATQGWYPYGFLDPGKQHAFVAAYVFGIAVGALIVFGVVWGLIWLRKWVTETKLGKTGKFAHESRSRDEMAEAGLELPITPNK
ncbi:hypothetical protein OQA88_4190 [Cercophora sp. LCS_1]